MCLHCMYICMHFDTVTLHKRKIPVKTASKYPYTIVSSKTDFLKYLVSLVNESYSTVVTV